MAAPPRKLRMNRGKALAEIFADQDSDVSDFSDSEFKSSVSEESEEEEKEDEGEHNESGKEAYENECKKCTWSSTRQPWSKKRMWRMFNFSHKSYLLPSQDFTSHPELINESLQLSYSRFNSTQSKSNHNN